MPDSRREVILDTAARLFGERGYAGVSMDEIGAAVEASGPSLYWHFPNKQALLEAVAVTGAERFAATIAALGDDPGFEDVARTEVGIVLDNPHYTRALVLERHRIEADEQLVAADARNMRVMAPALQRLNPALDDGLVQLRLFTQLGPLSVLTPSPWAIPRTRLTEITTAAIVALGAAAPAPRGEPRPRGRWQPTRTRPDAILHAARRLFRARGYEDVNLQDIAAAAGLSRPSLYHYFANKAEILEEAWRREMTRFVVGTWDAVDGAADADDALDRLAGAYVTVMLDCVDILGVFQRRPADAPDLGETRHSLRHQVSEAWIAALGEVRPDLDATEARAVTEMAFNVAAWGAMAVGGDHTWQPEVTAMTAAFVRG